MSTFTTQGSSNLYSQSGGVVASSSLVNAIKSTRAPSTSDIRGPQGSYSVGQRWVDTSALATYTLVSLTSSQGTVSATWVVEGGGTSQLSQLTGDTGTATPAAGSITIAGGAGVTTSASGSTVTIALNGGGVAIDSLIPQSGITPITPTAAGAVTIQGGYVAAGTVPVQTNGLPANTLQVDVQVSQAIAAADGTKVGLCNFSSSQFAVDPTGFVTLAGGGQAIDSFTPDAGTSPVVPSATGLVTMAGTANQITTTGGLNSLTFSVPPTFTSPGLITAASGNITATNGNFVRGTAGNKDVYSSVASTTTAGANSAGTVTLVGGTATVSTTAVTASSLIRIYRQAIGATGAAALGILTIGTITAATSFVINSVQAANATALQASDVSVVFWEIVN